MKKTLKLLFIALGAFTLAACSGTLDNKTSDSKKTVEPTTQQPPQTVEYAEVSDSDVESGKYMLNKDVYNIDKVSKKVTVTTVENYDQYKNNTGTLKLDVAIKFIKYSECNAIYFKDDSKEYFVYVNGTSTFIDTKTKTSTSSSGLAQMTIAEVETGIYVSEEQEQYKVDNDGNRIEEGDSFVKERFYLFFDLTDTSLKVYVGSDSKTYGGTPIYSLDNYVLELIHGKLYIRIPHQNSYYKCSLRFDGNGVVYFKNDYEKYGDYSAVGYLTKLQK